MMVSPLISPAADRGRPWTNFSHLFDYEGIVFRLIFRSRRVPHPG